MANTEPISEIATMQKALYALIKIADLSEVEAARLTLGDLNLSGAKPSVRIWQPDTGEQHTVILPAEVRQAIVNWMIVRPDKPVPILFVGEHNEEYTIEEIQQFLEGVTPIQSLSPSKEERQGMRLAKNVAPLPRQQTPPPFTPHLPSSKPEKVIDNVDANPPPLPTTPEIEKPTVSDTKPSTPKIKKVQATRPSPQLSMQNKIVQLVQTIKMQLQKVASHQSFSHVRWAASKWLPIIVSILVLFMCGGSFLLSMVFLFPGGLSSANGVADETALMPAKFETSLPMPTNTDIATSTPTSTNTATYVLHTRTKKPSIIEPISTNSAVPIENIPTETPTPILPTPTDTNTLIPATDTPIPTPTDTNTPMPAPTPIPITTTVELEEFYSTPQLLYPEMNEIFIHGNTIELRWKPVGELAENEYYAVRLNYMYQGQPADGGKNTNETTWTIPLNIDRPADGPGFNYTWYVYVERTIDGNPIPVSHESEHRQFTWER